LACAVGISATIGRRIGISQIRANITLLTVLLEAKKSGITLGRRRAGSLAKTLHALKPIVARRRAFICGFRIA
jgi:hypothetical protein